MRYVFSSAKSAASAAVSSRELCKSRPNGFSTMTRVSPDSDETCRAAFCATGTKMDGGMDR